MKYLMWIFAGLFVVFGLLILVVEDEAMRQILAGMTTLALGGFGVAMVRDALMTGRIRLQHSTIHRASKPRMFWASVMLVAFTSLVVLVSGVWFLFFKN